MSILDEYFPDQKGNLAEASLSRPKNPLHPNISDEDYEMVREVYYPVHRLYQAFFEEYCFLSSLEEVNKRVTTVLTRVIPGFSHPEGIWSRYDDLITTRTMVYNALYPATYDDMVAFLKEVHSGCLEFMCQYPDREGVKPIDRIKSLDVLLLHNV